MRIKLEDDKTGTYLQDDYHPCKLRRQPDLFGDNSSFHLRLGFGNWAKLVFYYYYHYYHFNESNIASRSMGLNYWRRMRYTRFCLSYLNRPMACPGGSGLCGALRIALLAGDRTGPGTGG